MKIEYVKKVDYLAEAADMIMRGRTPMPEAQSRNLMDIKKRWQVLSDLFGSSQAGSVYHQYCDSIEAAYLYGKKAAAAIPEDKLDFYFSPVYNSALSNAYILLRGKEYADRLGKPFAALTDSERKLAELSMLYAILPYESYPLRPDNIPDLYDVIEKDLTDDKEKWGFLRLAHKVEVYLAELLQLLAPVAGMLKEKADSIEPIVLGSVENLQRKIEINSSYLKDRFNISPTEDKPLVVSSYFMRYGEITYLQTPERQYLEVGVLCDEILENSKDRITDELILEGLKVLGDKRRLAIMCLLKERPHYGQELAEKLSLTPATISHHINQLINVRFIVIEHDGTKLIYSIAEPFLKRFISAFQKMLTED